MAFGNVSTNDSAQGTILNTETVVVDRVPVIFTLYDNNGVLSETVSLGKSTKFNQMSAIDREKLKNSILAIAEQRDKNVYRMLAQNDPSLPDDLPPRSIAEYHEWTEEKNNSAAGTGAGENPNTYAGHWSMIDYSVLDTSAGMDAYDGASSGSLQVKNSDSCQTA
jgi:hypothetical protein